MARRHLSSLRLVEQQRVVRSYGEPAIGLDLGIELARAPAGIAEREEAVARAFAAADRAQDVHRRGDADIAHDQRRLLGVIGRMQHEAARRLDRAAEMHRRAAEAVAFDAELLQKLAHRGCSTVLLTMRPIAPSALCAHMKTTERLKRGSSICGIAINNWPVSEVKKRLPFARLR